MVALTQGITRPGHGRFRIDSQEGRMHITPWTLEGSDPGDLLLITHGCHDHLFPEDMAKIRTANTVVIGTAWVAAELGRRVQSVEAGIGRGRNALSRALLLPPHASSRAQL